MEKSWENFWATGKVEDYLAYCNYHVEEQQYKEKDILTSCDTKESGTWKNEMRITRETNIGL